MSDKDVAENSKASAAAPLWWNTLTLVSLGLLVIHLGLRYAPMFIDGKWPESGGLDPVGLALVFLAAMPFLAPHLNLAKLPGGFEFAFRQVQRRQNVAEEEIAQLRFIVNGFVTDAELRHLKNIRDNVSYRPDDKDISVLQNELRRLLALGLIDRREINLGVRNFAIADGRERNIGDWFQLEPRGIEYLAMRARNEAEQAGNALN